jgi:hypothetical protein
MVTSSRASVMLAAVLAALLPARRVAAQSGESPEHEGFRAHVARDGTVRFESRHAIQHGLGMAFDVTDELMRSQGIDPYASAKLLLLDRTRDARAEMRRVDTLERLSHSAEDMRASIAAAWAVPDLAQRKQLLFELWDACAETGDPALVAGANAARAELVAFVQRYLTGGEAYTAEELARLNAHRTSSAAFDPYRTP